MEHTEQRIWQRFLNKNVSLTKLIKGRVFFYRGVVVKVLEDKLILDDRKLGEIPLSFEGLSIIAVNEGEQ